MPRELEYDEYEGDQICCLLKLGYTMEECAYLCDISTSTIYKWREVVPTFAEKCSKARAFFDYQSSKALELLMKPRVIVKEKVYTYINKAGQKKTSTEILTETHPPDTAVILNHVNKRAKIYQEAQLESNKGAFNRELESASAQYSANAVLPTEAISETGDKPIREQVED
jgi:hypothetical protein